MKPHRLPWILIASLAGVGLASGQPGPGPRPPPHHVDDVDAPTLSAAVIERALTPYLDGIGACYRAQVRSERATGHLRLELAIAPGGAVERVAVVAPGVSGAERARLVACVRAQTRTWHFPIRGGSTWAVVPFYFHKARAPGAGAQPSCWSPRGCALRGDKERP